MKETVFPDQTTTLSEWLSKAAVLLPDSDSAKLDIEVLLCHLLNQSRTYLYTWPERTLSEAQYHQFLEALEQRQQGHPVAHIVGFREFWSLPLQVSPSTLIPRPDTETLIEWVLDQFSDAHAGQVSQEPFRAVDLGTGTGAIALALASEFPAWDVCGCDRVPEAVTLAKSNAEQLGLERVRFFESSWFDGFDYSQQAGSFHLIITNPPYIPASDPHLSQGDVVFEPKSALVAGEDGLDDIRHIIGQSLHYLADGGCLLIEHGYDQAASVAALFELAGYVDVGSGKDYGGNDRFTFGWKPTLEERGE